MGLGILQLLTTSLGCCPILPHPAKEGQSILPSTQQKCRRWGIVQTDPCQSRRRLSTGVRRKFLGLLSYPRQGPKARRFCEAAQAGHCMIPGAQFTKIMICVVAPAVVPHGKCAWKDLSKLEVTSCLLHQGPKRRQGGRRDLGFLGNMPAGIPEKSTWNSSSVFPPLNMWMPSTKGTLLCA